MTEEKEVRKGFPDTEKVIDEALQREDWFSAFTNAVTFFEFWGYWRLRWYCIQEKMGLENELKHLHVSTLALLLYFSKQIDASTYSRMRKVLKERNKLTHPISTEAGITYRDRKERDRAIEILTDAKCCIKKLKEGIGKPRKNKQTG